MTIPPPLVRAWPFALAVLGVLATHELRHYALSRYHDVEATLPYFIPIPNVLGTLGAVIRMKDTIPSRRALFDIGVVGPLAGLAATVVVTAVSVSLPRGGTRVDDRRPTRTGLFSAPGPPRPSTRRPSTGNGRSSGW